MKKTAQHLVAAVAPRVWHWGGPKLVVIMYHRVLPGGHAARATEQPGMYVSPETLQLHIRTLREHFHLMHLDDWLRAVADGAPPPDACAITFDDGWRDNYQHAWPVLRAEAAPSTIYLVTDLVGTSYSFWPNSLARLLAEPGPVHRQRLPSWLRALLPGDAALDAGAIDQVIMACKASRTDAEMLAVLQAATGGEPVERELMSWEEIREMQADGLTRFGSHTRRHTRLSTVRTAAELDDEIEGSGREIERHLGSRPVSFCYPNGDMSPEAVNRVRTAYRGAVTTQPGWNRPGADPFLLNRLGMHEDVSASRAEFLSRLAGVG